MVYMRMKMPNPGAASPRVRLQGLFPSSGGGRFCRMTAFLWHCPARGGGRGAGRLGLPGADVAARSEVGGSSLDLSQVCG